MNRQRETTPSPDAPEPPDPARSNLVHGSPAHGSPAHGNPARVNPARVNPDRALAALKDADTRPSDIEQIVADSALMKSRKVRLAVAAHLRTPRRIALRLIRELYTFDLMQFSLMPVAPADLKRIADDQLVTRLASVSLGERVSLARRSSGRVAAALLLDKESRVWQAALENPRITEAAVVRAVQKNGSSPAFIEAVCRHSKWSLRVEIRSALLRNAHTPLARALEFARRIPPAQLRDILHTSHLPEKIKEYLRKEMRAKG
jgi:hypothetical protein